VWFQKHDHDIYRIVLEVDQFLDFPAGYKKIRDKREMEKFAKEFIDENYGIEGIFALHIYGDCYCHVDLRTTENYLDSFAIEVKKEFAGKLVSFKR
jgi:hypothetical protein